MNARAQRGTVLLSVVVALALIATLAFMLAREGAMGAGDAARAIEGDAANYVAEAGLRHAVWKANSSNCTSYDLPVTAFGPNSYTATFTPTSSSPVTIAATGTLAGGSSATHVRTNVSIYQPPSTLVLQPGAATEDTYINDGTPTTNFASDPEIRISNKTNSQKRGLLRFDLSSINSATTVTSATLELNLEGIGSGGTATVDVSRITTSWLEDQTNWNNAQTGSPWTTLGGDYEATPIATAAIDASLPGPTQWDITLAAADWIAKPASNFGLMLTGSAGVNHADFTTGDAPDATKHPKLTITYACECGKTCVSGGGGGNNILFVVGEPTNLTPEQVAKKALMESWGHTLTLIATSESQTAFDTAAASVDVVYVPELGSTAMSELGTKADSLSTGVITEESRRALLLGDFSLFPFVDTDTINITDNSHYLTEPLAVGPVQLSTAVQSMWVLKPTLALDLHVLGQLNGTEPGLAYLEVGERLNDGNPAPARRVKLPWGAYQFDVNLLTDDGLEIMKRAIEWGAAGTGPIAHWKLDDSTGPIAVDSVGGHDGTLTGPAWTTGQLDGALDFDGLDDYVDVGSFDVSGSGLTLMAWFNAESIPTSDGRFISKANGPNASDAWWQLSTTDSGSNRYLRMRVKAGSTTTTFADSSVNLTTGRWYFAVATYDNASGDMKLYLDGTEIASGTHAVGGPVDTDPAVPVAIGANGTAERFFDGVLDDVRVYDRALSAGAIADLYAEGMGGALLAHWKLDDGTGPIAVDSVGGHDGTLAGGPAWTTGQLDGALHFDGADDYVDLTSDAALDDVFLNGATVMAWIEPVGWGENGYGRIFDKSSSPSATGDGWVIRMNVDNGGIINFGQGFTSGRGWWKIPNASISLNTWQHIAVAYDASSAANDPIIYLNGSPLLVSEVDTPSGDVRSDASINLRLGNHAGGTAHTFDGKIDDARIYGRILDAAEIADIAAGGGGGGGCDDTFRDEFAVQSYSNNDGTLAWSTDWLEINESDGPTKGDEAIVLGDGNYLQVRDNDSGGEGVEREAALSGYTTAILTFGYRRISFDNPNDYVTLDISDNGGSSWTELDRFQGAGHDTAYVPVSYDIAPYIADNTRIRFLTSPDLGVTDELRIQNLEIAVSACP